MTIYGQLKRKLKAVRHADAESGSTTDAAEASLSRSASYSDSESSDDVDPVELKSLSQSHAAKSMATSSEDDGGDDPQASSRDSSEDGSGDPQASSRDSSEDGGGHFEASSRDSSEDDGNSSEESPTDSGEKEGFASSADSGDRSDESSTSHEDDGGNDSVDPTMGSGDDSALNQFGTSSAAAGYSYAPPYEPPAEKLRNPVKVFRKQYERGLYATVQRALAAGGPQWKELRSQYDLVETGMYANKNEIDFDALRPQLEKLEELAKMELASLGQEIAQRELLIDFERMRPIVKRALVADGKRRQELEVQRDLVETGMSAKEVDVEALKPQLKVLEELAREELASMSVDNAVRQQEASLPVPREEVGVGNFLGKGKFGEVFKLNGSPAETPLVGKTFDPSDKNAQKEMASEEAMYARLGEHPNIVRCYGIHDIDSQPAVGGGSNVAPGRRMLVMQEIKGGDLNSVFDDLEQRYKNGKIGREDFLGSIQHLIKGTLQGLAHFEALGLVHKDIKGDNIMVDKQTGQAVLIDMGLAQEEGVDATGKKFTATRPPEDFVAEKGDETVTTVWDSFAVGKLLFPLMEQSKTGSKKGKHEIGARHQFITGDGPRKAVRHTGADVPDVPEGTLPGVLHSGAKASLTRSPVTGRTRANEKSDVPVGAALKESEDNVANPGTYNAKMDYVDFMNLLTHPDPERRLKPSEALRHPFLADALLGPDQVKKLMATAPEVAPVSPEETAYTQGLSEEALRVKHPDSAKLKDQTLKELPAAEAIKVRLRALVSPIKEAVETDHPQVQDIKLWVAEAGKLTRKGEYKTANELLDDVVRALEIRA